MLLKLEKLKKKKPVPVNIIQESINYWRKIGYI